MFIYVYVNVLFIYILYRHINKHKHITQIYIYFNTMIYMIYIMHKIYTYINI